MTDNLHFCLHKNIFFNKHDSEICCKDCGNKWGKLSKHSHSTPQFSLTGNLRVPYTQQWDDSLNETRSEIGEDLKRLDLSSGEPSKLLMNGEVPEEYLGEYIETAILDELYNEGGIPAWKGDGVGCVRNIIEKLYEKAYCQKNNK